MPSKRARKGAAKGVKYDNIDEELEVVTAQVVDTMRSLQNLLDSITRRTAELKEYEKRVEDMDALMKANRDKVASITKLNLRGKKFSVYKSILLKVGGTYFVGMLSSAMFEPDYEGAYYIDRCSEGFERILAYLDTGVLSLQGLNEYEEECVYDNLDYFCISFKRQWKYTEATPVEGLNLKFKTLLHDGRLCARNTTHDLCIYDMDTNSIETTLVGHSGPAIGVIQLSDGRLCSCSSDKTIKLWNSESSICELTMHGHSDFVCCVIQMQDGRICSGSRDETLKIWNKDNGVCELSINTGSSILSVAQLNDGRICSGDDEGAIHVWNSTTGECEMTLDEHTDGVKTLLVIHNVLYSCSDDSTIKKWNVNTGLCELTLEDHNAAVNSIIFLEDGRLCSISSDGCLKVWNIDTGECELSKKHRAAHDDQDINFSLIQLQDGRLVTSVNSIAYLWR
jgi:WD40 repeat protein